MEEGLFSRAGGILQEIKIIYTFREGSQEMKTNFIRLGRDCGGIYKSPVISASQK